MNIKLNDVYRFRYNDEYNSNGKDNYWCFDGQLVVKKGREDILILQDTYWSSDSKTFLLEEALKKGSLEFICNMEDVVKCQENDRKYYKPEDVFDLSCQHHYRKAIYRSKKAKKDLSIMQESLEDMISEAKWEIKYAQNSLDRLQEKLEKVKSGDMDVYI